MAPSWSGAPRQTRASRWSERKKPPNCFCRSAQCAAASPFVKAGRQAGWNGWYAPAADLVAWLQPRVTQHTSRIQKPVRPTMINDRMIGDASQRDLPESCQLKAYTVSLVRVRSQGGIILLLKILILPDQNLSDQVPISTSYFQIFSN